MKKLYYTVDTELNGNQFNTTGYKLIVVYTIENDRPKVFCDIESLLKNKPEVEIQHWLDENGFENQEFEFILL